MTSTIHKDTVQLNNINNANELIDRLAYAIDRLGLAARAAGEQLAWDRLKFESNFDVDAYWGDPRDGRRVIEITAIGINNGN
jgi:hypothetical protein